MFTDGPLRAPALWYVSLPCHCIGGSARALAAMDAFERRLSGVCPCHCDLQSIGGSAVALAAMDAFERRLSSVCPSIVIICSL